MPLLLDVLIPWDSPDRANNDARSEYQQCRNDHTEEAASSELFRFKPKVERILRQAFSSEHGITGTPHSEADLKLIDREELAHVLFAIESDLFIECDFILQPKAS